MVFETNVATCSRMQVENMEPLNYIPTQPTLEVSFSIDTSISEEGDEEDSDEEENEVE